MSTATAEPTTIGDLTIDERLWRVTLDGREVKLTRTEFRLLCKLAHDPERVVQKAELLRDVWGWSGGHGTSVRTLDSHAARLRVKLERRYVHNIWGVGYRLTFPA